MTRNIQTGRNPIAEEGYAVTTRVVTGTELLCPLRILSRVMYGGLTLVPTQASNCVP